MEMSANFGSDGGLLFTSSGYNGIENSRHKKLPRISHLFEDIGQNLRFR